MRRRGYSRSQVEYGDGRDRTLSAPRQSSKNMDKALAFEELLRAGRWFGGLDPAFRHALLHGASIKKLAKEATLFVRGDASNGMYAIVDGSVRISGSTPAGAEVVLVILESPMWFGENSILDSLPRGQDAIACEATTLVHVAQSSLVQILEQEPLFWRDLGVLVTARLRLVFTAMEDAGQPIAVRLARRLVLSAERYGDWQGRSSRQVGLKQAQLATMLSSSRQTVNQILKRFEAQGLIQLAYGRVEILDLDRLRVCSQPRA